MAMREVTHDEFWRAVHAAKFDIVTSVQGHKYPYRTDFKLRNGDLVAQERPVEGALPYLDEHTHHLCEKTFPVKT